MDKYDRLDYFEGRRNIPLCKKKKHLRGNLKKGGEGYR